MTLELRHWMKMAGWVRSELLRADLTSRKRLLMELILWATLMRQRQSVRVPRLEDLEPVTGMTKGHISTNLRELAEARILQIVPLPTGGTEYVLLPDSRAWVTGWLYERAEWQKVLRDLDAFTGQIQEELLPPDPNLLAALAEVSAENWFRNAEPVPESGTSSGKRNELVPESGTSSGKRNQTSEPWDQAEYLRLCQSGDVVAADKMWRDGHPPVVKGGKGGHDMHVPRRGKKKHDMHVQRVGSGMRNQPWQPQRLLDVGELDLRTAGEIWQALQKASGGAISQEFEAGWKRRISEAAHIVWSIARECSERKDLKNSVGWLNREYLRALCPK